MSSGSVIALFLWCRLSDALLCATAYCLVSETKVVNTAWKVQKRLDRGHTQAIYSITGELEMVLLESVATLRWLCGLVLRRFIESLRDGMPWGLGWLQRR